MDTQTLPGSTNRMVRPTRRRRRVRPTRWPALLASIAAVLPLSGCVGGDRDRDAGGEASPPVVEAKTTAPAGPVDLEAFYVIGPDAARTLDYRVDWQVRALPDAGALRSVQIQHDSVFALDSRNYLTRFRREDGRRLWRVPVAKPWEEIIGITFVAEAERIYLTTGGSLLVLDALTGSTVNRQRLEKVANTEPVQVGTYLVYGARNGQLVWHAYPVAFQWRAYQVSRSIQMKPLLYDQVIVCVGNDGRVMALDATSASQLWDKRLLDAVVARPVAGNDAVFLAGTDQYLYAFDAYTGRTLWSRLTSSPLSSSPTLIDRHVYQQIPGEGLACFDAFVLDDPDGAIVWRSADVTGSVVTSRNRKLLAWDGRSRSMAIVDDRGGGLVTSVELPQTRHVLATSTSNGVLYAIADDGRIERLVPRN